MPETPAGHGPLAVYLSGIAATVLRNLAAQWGREAERADGLATQREAADDLFGEEAGHA